MNRKEKSLLRKILELNTFVINNLNEENVDEFLSIYRSFENSLMEVVKKSMNKRRTPSREITPPIWEKFSAMTEEEIRREFADVEKYPDMASIKSAVKGFIELRKVSKVKTRETLIKHIINAYKKGEFISKIGKKAKDQE